MKHLSRREFLKVSAINLGAVVVSTGLSGCFHHDDGDAIPVSFNHGVASGDPDTDRVILWTRVTPQIGSPVGIRVSWEVASDIGFTNLLQNGTTQAMSDGDYTVKVDAQNLSAGTTYYYRFKSGSAVSATGKTKTLPQGSLDKVTLAVFSCSNYPAGHFNAYAEAAKRTDLDAVLHLGDYIYEYGTGGYATANAASIGRSLPADNAGEIISLADYRKRYALYRTDSNLQTLHHLAPFIVVWDDHEVANDTYEDGAQNHNDGEGAFSDRKLAALQAFFEWMPIRPVVPADNEVIYRSFEFGNLVSLYMMDSRVIGRDKQLAYHDYLSSDNSLNKEQFIADLTNSNRTLLGDEQLQWLTNGLSSSNAVWQVLGQQILMGRMLVPQEMVIKLGILEIALSEGDTATAATLQSELQTLLRDLFFLKSRYDSKDPTLTEADIARVEPAARIPYNLDAWDGYHVEREVVLTSAQNNNSNLIVLAGDTHNAWANNIRKADPNTGYPTGEPVAVEFATSSVSSPGLEEYLGIVTNDEVVDNQNAGLAELVINTLIDDLEYMNANNRGFMVVTFTPNEARSDWYFVNNVKSTNYTVAETRAKSFKVLPGAGNRRLVGV